MGNEENKIMLNEYLNAGFCHSCFKLVIKNVRSATRL